jgi:hypothetical protein
VSSAESIVDEHSFPVDPHQQPIEPVDQRTDARRRADLFDPSGHGLLLSTAGYLRGFLPLLRGVPRFKRNLFTFHRLSHYLHKLDRVYDDFVQAVHPSCRIDRQLSLDISTPAGQGSWA